jgi:hypothetical protein
MPATAQQAPHPQADDSCVSRSNPVRTTFAMCVSGMAAIIARSVRSSSRTFSSGRPSEQAQLCGGWSSRVARLAASVLCHHIGVLVFQDVAVP